MSHVRLATLAGFSEIVKSLNGDLESILAHSDLDAELLLPQYYDEYVTVEKLHTLLVNATHQTKTPELAFKIGLSRDYRATGILGLLLQQSKNVEELISRLVLFLALHARDTLSMKTQSLDQGIAIIFVPGSHLEQDSWILHDLVLGRLISIFKKTCGEEFKFDKVCLKARNKELIEKYKKMSDENIQMGCDFDGLIVPNQWLKSELKTRDPQLDVLLTKYLSENGAILEPITVSVESLIAQNLSSGNLSNELVADKLAMSKRTLTRKLAREDHSYKELLTAFRKSEACKLLKNSNYTISEIAFELGYSEISSFTSAFKIWFDDTPLKWRSQHKRKAQ